MLGYYDKALTVAKAGAPEASKLARWRIATAIRKGWDFSGYPSVETLMGLKEAIVADAERKLPLVGLGIIAGFGGFLSAGLLGHSLAAVAFFIAAIAASAALVYYLVRLYRSFSRAGHLAWHAVSEIDESVRKARLREFEQARDE